MKSKKRSAPKILFSLIFVLLLSVLFMSNNQQASAIMQSPEDVLAEFSQIQQNNFTQDEIQAALDDLTGNEVGFAAIVGMIMMFGMYGFPLVFFLVIVIIVVRRAKKHKKDDNVTYQFGGHGRPGGFTIATKTNKYIPLNQYRLIDPYFSETEFNEKVSNVFVRYMHSLCEADLTDVRPYFSDSLYAQLQQQKSEECIGRNRRRVIESLTVDNISILGFRQEYGNDVIAVDIRYTCRDYIEDIQTHEIIKGESRGKRTNLEEWIFVRTRYNAKQRRNSDEPRMHICPNCSASVNINQSAVCPYCDSVLYLDDFEWVVNNIRKKEI